MSESISIDDAVRAMSRWVRDYNDHPTAADVDHSSLLRRLLSGKEPLPFKPPKRYSYPDYALGEGERCIATEVWETKNSWLKTERDVLIIDQSAWNIIERRADGWLVEWPDEPGSRYEVIQRPNAELQIVNGQPTSDFGRYAIQRVRDSRPSVGSGETE